MIGGDLMGAGALGAFLLDATLGRPPGGDIFRLEQLPLYTVATDGEDYRRWLDGADDPDWSRKAVTTDVLARWAAHQVSSRRVRVFSVELTDYERYARDWGYAINGPAGEDIRVLHHGEHAVPALVGIDYYLIDHHTVVRMHYGGAGEFLGADDAPDLLRAVLHEQDVLWRVAEPFGSWWARHTELRRRPVS